MLMSRWQKKHPRRGGAGVPWGGGWAGPPPQRVSAFRPRPVYERWSPMAMVTCKGCSRRYREIEVRQCRIYSRTKQYQFRFKLCVTCWGGLFDLLRESCDGMTEGLWNPIGISSAT